MTMMKTKTKTKRMKIQVECKILFLKFSLSNKSRNVSITNSVPISVSNNKRNENGFNLNQSKLFQQNGLGLTEKCLAGYVMILIGTKQSNNHDHSKTRNTISNNVKRNMRTAVPLKAPEY